MTLFGEPIDSLTPVKVLGTTRRGGLKYYRMQTPSGWKLLVPETDVRNGAEGPKVHFDTLKPETDARVKSAVDRLVKKFKK